MRRRYALKQFPRIENANGENTPTTAANICEGCKRSSSTTLYLIFPYLHLQNSSLSCNFSQTLCLTLKKTKFESLEWLNLCNIRSSRVGWNADNNCCMCTPCIWANICSYIWNSKLGLNMIVRVVFAQNCQSG